MEIKKSNNPSDFRKKLLIIFMVFFPIFILPLSNDGSIVFIYGKLAFLAVWLSLAVAQYKSEVVASIKSRLKSKHKFTDISLLISLTLIFISQFKAGQGILFLEERAEGGLTGMLLICVYLIFRSSASLKAEKVVGKYWPIFILPISLIAMLQYLFPNAIWLDFLSHSAKDAQPGSTFGNRGALSAYVILVIPLAFLWIKKTTIRTVYSIPFFVFLGIVLSISQTRAAFLGCIAGIILLFTVNLFLKNREAIKEILFYASLFFLGLIVGFAIPNSDRDKHFKSPDSGRQILWTIAAKAIEEKPFFGWGAGGYRNAFNKYADWQNDENIRDYLIPESDDKNTHFSLEQDHSGIYILEKRDLGIVTTLTRELAINNRAHSEYLDKAVQYGLPYLLLYIFWHIQLLRKNIFVNEEGIYLVSGIFAIMIFNIFWMNSITFLPIYYALLGLLDNDHKRQRATSPASASPFSPPQ